VFVRAGNTGPFTSIALTRGSDSSAGRYFANLPPSIAHSPTGFSYYAVLRDEATGAETTLPAGGASSPQRSYLLEAPLTVRLGEHRFGAARAPDARVVDAKWGAGPRDVGLIGGDALGRIGPSSFDVGADGTVSVLDEANRRVVRWRGRDVSSVTVDVPPAIDDLAVGPDGTMFVVDGSSAPGRTPLLRTFGADGTLRAEEHLAERTWSQVRADVHGAVIDEHPSEQWMRPGNGERGTPSRPLADGSGLVVFRSGTNELRVARVVGDKVHQSWRVTSDTPLGEVQLADRFGNRLVLVVRTYSETEDEFVVLVVNGDGTLRRFNVASNAWAETAPLARFRLAGDSLYELGSSPTGAFVTRYDLGGER
jgi:hypothetical protein